MKTPSTLIPWVLIGAASACFGQSFDSGTFFQPVFKVERPPVVGVDLEVLNNDLYSAGTSAGDVSWTLGAGGYSGVSVSVVAGVHLNAVTRTTGNSLVFGRELDVVGLLGGPLLTQTLATVTGADVLSSWSATADVTGLDIQANQLYQVTFDISTGPNIPASLLTTMEFDITSDDVTSFGNGADGLLNLADVIRINDGITSGQATLLFSSSTTRSDLRFQFDASSAASLGLLGSVEGNQNVLTFSNIQVTLIPEPSTSGLSVLALGGVILRRRRGK